MIVQCPACNSRYRIRDANIPPSGGKIRCPSCAHSFVVYPEQEEADEDRTSITNPNALNHLVSKMAPKGQPAAPAAEDNSTAIVSRGDAERIRAFQQMSADLGDADDGTVEIKNPMDVWKNAQSAIESARAAAAAASPAEEDSEADEYDAAPTEIVSGGNLPKLPFPGPKAKGPANPLPSPTVPTPAIQAPAAAAPTPSYPPLPKAAPPLPSVAPPMPAAPPKPVPPMPEPVRAAASPSFSTPSSASGGFPTASASNAFPTAKAPAIDPFSAPGPSTPAPVSVPDPYQEDGLSTQQLANPFTGSNAINPFGAPAAPQPDASANILAAIEETNAAQAPTAAPKADPNHQGPWKLKTDFGLTYEFPDVKSLRNWLASRDETDGFKLSADGTNFFAIRDFPQFERRVGMSQIGMQQPANLGTMPGEAAPGPSFNAPAFTPPPQNANASGSFSGAVVPGQYASYHGGPLPAAPQGPPVQNEYRPPSRASKDHKILWAMVVFLFVIAGMVAVHTLGFVNWLEIAGLDKKPVPVQPAQEKPLEKVESIENIVQNDVSDELEGLFKEVRRDLKNKKLQSALERLNTIEALAPDRPEVFQYRADAYEGLGEKDKAEAARTKAKELEDKAAAAKQAESDKANAAAPDAGAGTK